MHVRTRIATTITLVAVAAVIAAVATGSAMLMPITPRAICGVSGNSGRRSPVKETNTAHAASSPAKM